MGLEANCHCRWSGGSAEVKALLEADTLILRGGLRRSIPLASLITVQIAGNDLQLATNDEKLSLVLGETIAERWRKKMTTPAPSLREKLGIGPEAKALLVGEIDDPLILQALEGSLTSNPQEARLSVAFVSNATELAVALERHRVLAGKPIWIVHGKGKGSLLGEQPVRTAMRAEGFKDTKVSAVSPTRSATRYNLSA